MKKIVLLLGCCNFIFSMDKDDFIPDPLENFETNFVTIYDHERLQLEHFYETIKKGYHPSSVNNTIKYLLSNQTNKSIIEAAIKKQTLKLELEEIGAWYNPEPDYCADLTEKLVMNKFWSNTYPEEQDYFFEDVAMNKFYSKHTYHIQRCNIAASLYAGIETILMRIPSSSTGISPLHTAISFSDLPLLRLMQMYGVFQDSNWHDGSELFLAGTVAVARFLVASGADIFSKNPQTNLTIMQILEQKRDLCLSDEHITNLKNFYTEVIHFPDLEQKLILNDSSSIELEEINLHDVSFFNPLHMGNN